MTAARLAREVKLSALSQTATTEAVEGLASDPDAPGAPVR